MQHDEFKYQIGDKTYIQKPLVLGQIRQLTNLLQGMIIPGDASPLTIVSALGNKLSHAIAIVLIPSPLEAYGSEPTAQRGEGKGEGDLLKTKNIPDLASQIEFEISPETTLQVIEDFFDCNPIASLLERVTGMIGKISGSVKIGLKNLSAFSPKETSPNEMPSSGDTLPENASPISNIAAKT